MKNTLLLVSTIIAEPTSQTEEPKCLLQISMIEEGDSELPDLNDLAPPVDFDMSMEPSDLPEMDDDFFKVMSELPNDFEEQMAQADKFMQDMVLEDVDPDCDLFDFDDEEEPVEQEFSPDEIMDGEATAYAFGNDH
jgi:hypothetical protein